MTASGFPPSARLRNAVDFAPLRTARHSHRGRFFHVRYVPGTTTTPRLGMAVSRKTSKRAVARNRIKRTLRESFRQAREFLPVLDIMVIARSAAASATTTEMRAELDTLWARLQAKSAQDPVANHPAGLPKSEPGPQ